MSDFLCAVNNCNLSEIVKAASMFHEYDVVQLKRDIPAIALKAGSIGAIVMVYTNDKDTHAYEVEFVDENGETLALQTLGEDDIEKAEAKP